MARIVDIILKILKWPVAVFLLLSIPALLQSYDYFNFRNIKFYAMGAEFGNQLIQFTHCFDPQSRR